MGTGNKVRDPNVFEERIESLIFPSPISMYGSDFLFETPFN
jgi:hypothetical protein